jgi:hypothetical protein
MQPISSQYARQLAALKVLIVNGESTMRNGVADSQLALID